MDEAPGERRTELVSALETDGDRLSALTPRERAVFELRDWEGRTTDETAEALGLRPGAGRVHLHRARLRLRAALAARYGGAAA